MTPAASSKALRRAPGFAESNSSIFPCPTMEYPSRPMPVSRTMSKMSLSRTGVRFRRYSLSPDRNILRVTTISL